MTRALFLVSGDSFYSFTVKGHSSGSAAAGHDIVCAAISSAVYLTANTAECILGADMTVKEYDGFFSARLGSIGVSSDLIKGLALHLVALSKQYPDKIQVRIINTSHSEVQNNA